MLNEPSLQALAALDQREGRLNNEAVFNRAAKRVKDWRKQEGLDQISFAKLAKVSVGCLQGFETGTRATRKRNLHKIAQAMGLTSDQLLADDDVSLVKPDPLLKDLRREDLRHANHFHHAGAEAKHAAKAFLSPELPDDLREQIALVLEQLLQLDTDALMELAQNITALRARRGAP